MKDITIKGERVKRELMVFLLSFVMAFGLNIYAIIVYKTEWNELFTYLHVVVLISFVIYFLLGLIRGIIALVKKMVR